MSYLSLLNIFSISFHPLEIKITKFKKLNNRKYLKMRLLRCVYWYPFK